MAEAEDVIIDAARHATEFAQGLWRRRRAAAPGERPQLALADIAGRLDLLLCAALGQSFPIRPAQPPAPVTFLERVFERRRDPGATLPLPATDGRTLWLPPALGIADADEAAARYRVLALQQALRAQRGSAAGLPDAATAAERDVYLLLEAQAADAALIGLLPGLAPALLAARAAALAARPPLPRVHESGRPLERLLRALLAAPPGSGRLVPLCPSPAESQAAARALAADLAPARSGRRARAAPLQRDWWIGELRRAEPADAHALEAPDAARADGRDPPRSARLHRRPAVREAAPGEDDAAPGAWMVQTAQPHEHVEDPLGAQRPTDRDAGTAAEELADSVSELRAARLVATPGRAAEILLADDPIERRARRAPAAPGAGTRLAYPEWDHRVAGYRLPGAIVHLLPAAEGPQAWVDRTLGEHRAMLDAIRRRFELLRAQRVRLRRQLDGDDIDLEACVESRADFRAGLPLSQACYLRTRPARRNMAVMLLIDVSGSTDGWISAQQRVIDVERVALLLVCNALDAMAEPYAVQAFSGEGPEAVTIRTLKRFDERYDERIARRIAALEPEHYTRAGAALRHATALLMREPARHRLLLLLSDGKPNDVDHYEGRYGVEDMRQAVGEARMQGISPFCLTIDRQAAGYLPRIFGAGQYALLPRPELLPTVLVQWVRRLLTA